MEKNKLFQIGEVSKLFHISVSILRHYDKIGLVRPEYTDPDTGYRYYSSRQFECLNTIRYLRALDTPLEQIAHFLQNRKIDNIHELLLRQKAEVKKRQKELSIIERKIDNRLRQIADAENSKLDMITITRKSPRRLAFVKKKLNPENSVDLEYSIRKLEELEKDTVIFLGKVGLGISKEKLEKKQYQQYDRVFVILEEEDVFEGATIQVPEEICVTIRFRGEHKHAANSYEKLIQYIEENSYNIDGFSKEITMIDYGLTDDISQFITEIQIPVRKKSE